MSSRFKDSFFTENTTWSSDDETSLEGSLVFVAVPLEAEDDFNVSNLPFPSELASLIYSLIPFSFSLPLMLIGSLYFIDVGSLYFTEL